MSIPEETNPGPTSPDDLDTTVYLVRRSKAGDEEALNALLVRYQDRVRRLVRIRMGAKLRLGFESVDLVQETLAAAAANLDKFEMTEPASLIRWLTTIAEYRIKNAAEWLGAQKRDPARERPLAITDPGNSRARELAASTPSPAAQAEQRELEELVDAAVAALRPEWREVIMLREYEGGSWKYVAAEMQRSIRAVESLHLRARAALSQQLQAHRADKSDSAPR